MKPLFRAKSLIKPELEVWFRQGQIVDRQEAAVVLRDVLAECAGSLLTRCVLLEPVVPQTLEDYGRYEVRISCMVDDDLRRCISKVVEKHKLAMKQTGNVIILYRPKA